MAKHSRKKRSIGRRILIIFLLAIFCAGFFYWSNRSLQIERFTFSSSRLPQGFDGCTIVELSDLHGAVFGEDNTDLVSAVRGQSPDYIFLTGDLLDRFRETPHSYAVDLGRQLSAIAPTYFVTGQPRVGPAGPPGIEAGAGGGGSDSAGQPLRHLGTGRRSDPSGRHRRP